LVQPAVVPKKKAGAAGLHENSIRYWETRAVPSGHRPYAIERIEQALAMLGVIACRSLPWCAFVSGEQF